MKTLFATVAAIALIAGVGPVSAQMMQSTATMSGTAPWMMDDGSSSDHPIHNPDDISGERLNSQYVNGLTVPPDQGLPAR
jgi:hypothetical protein